MTTCLKEDVRSPVWEPAGTAADQRVDVSRDEICQDEVGQVMRTGAVPVEPESKGQLLDGSGPVAGRTRRLREAGFIAAAVVGLVLVPSVQSLGLGVDPAGVLPPNQDQGRQSPQLGDGIASREVQRLLGRD